MDEQDNSDLILESVLNTHNQQLETLRQQRSSLIRITNINIVLMGILLGLYGSVFQNIDEKGVVFAIPFLFFLSAGVYCAIRYITVGEAWGPVINLEKASEINELETEQAIEKMSQEYLDISQNNKFTIRKVQNTIRKALFLMAIAFGSTLFIIFALSILRSNSWIF